MVEFKQIIGLGTRLSEGKDYFTVYDFVEAHHHLQDPEWDGPPQAPNVLRGAHADQPRVKVSLWNPTKLRNHVRG